MQIRVKDIENSGAHWSITVLPIPLSAHWTITVIVHSPLCPLDHYCYCPFPSVPIGPLLFLSIPLCAHWSVTVLVHSPLCPLVHYRSCPFPSAARVRRKLAYCRVCGFSLLLRTHSQFCPWGTVKNKLSYPGSGFSDSQTSWRFPSRDQIQVP